ncbi:hypothetical protein ACBY01_07095 [Sphingomonas sp. ac-8]|uniref:hypothetical protein n=1 Tax=Sphingomonas sp. ac-8 TaxID=3242977 RepID=UPI003A80710E
MTISAAIAERFDAWRLAQLACHYAQPCPDEVMSALVASEGKMFGRLVNTPSLTADDLVLKLLPLALIEHGGMIGNPPLAPVVERDPGTQYQEDDIWESLIRDMAAVSPTLAAAMAPPPSQGDAGMSGTATDAELAAAIKGLTAGPGASLVDELKDRVRGAPTHTVRMDPAVAEAFLGELELARLTAAKLGVEVAAHRRNIKIADASPRSPMRECSNCLHYISALSPDATKSPEMQAIAKDAGACTANPPMSHQRGTAPHTSTVSIFPTVHPHWRCGRWELLTTAGLKVPSA